MGSHLQLALDHTSQEDALNLISKLSDKLTRIEIGTPLVLSAGLITVERVRALTPGPVTIVADVKICDAGERIAKRSFAAGADVITAVAAVADDYTWSGVLSAVRQIPRHTGADAPVLLDTIGMELDDSGHGSNSFRLRKMAVMARDAGVAVDLCIHRPKLASPSFKQLLSPFLETERLFERFVVAGKLSPGEVQSAFKAGFDTLVVGGAVADANDPVQTWNAFIGEVDSFHLKGNSQS